MKICLILEGCYPFVYGGVSSWIHQYILSKPEHEFILLTIGTKEKEKYVYDIPKNVIKINKVFLNKSNKIPTKKKMKYSSEFLTEVKNLILGKSVTWEIVFKETSKKDWNETAFFNSEDYLQLVEEIAQKEFNSNGYQQVFFSMQSMLQSLFFILGTDIPDADIYHACSTGYAGILGSLALYKNNKPFVVTEHGIYPREREEELLACSWLDENLKKVWIKFFYNISKVAYDYATLVTSLFLGAKKTQILLGCDEQKCHIVPNGIDYESFVCIPMKPSNKLIDIGAFVRFSSIKDVKTLLYSFYEAYNICRNIRLHIFGSINDEMYYEECMNLISLLDIEKVVQIHGQVNTVEYLAKVDFTILTSISEGQPLTILESFAAKRPVICTNVGCCQELIEGIDDDFGVAGICCAPMDTMAISKAIVELSKNKELIKLYGQNGQNRVKKYYTLKKMMTNYFKLYEGAIKKWQE